MSAPAMSDNEPGTCPEEYAGLTLAIIRNAGIGCRDTDYPILWFDVFISESSAALEVLDWSHAYQVLSKVTDIKDLEGRPCWVRRKPGEIKFVRLWAE